MEEIFKPVKGYEGIYEISNLGNIRNRKRILKPFIDLGYFRIDLCNNGNVERKKIHILVAEAFCEKPDGAVEVHHINKNKLDNRAENLVWLTHIEHQVIHQNIFAPKPIKRIDPNGNVVRFESAQAAGRAGFNTGHIIACCKGNEKTHKGFRWEYDI